jgi:hypothetical protein
VRTATRLRIVFPLIFVRTARSCPAEHERCGRKSVEVAAVRAVVLISLDAVLDEGAESAVEIRPSSQLRTCAPPGIRTQNLRIERALTTIGRVPGSTCDQAFSGLSSCPIRPVRSSWLEFAG